MVLTLAADCVMLFLEWHDLRISARQHPRWPILQKRKSEPPYSSIGFAIKRAEKGADQRSIGL
jgi:hypothetical protein